MSKLQKVLSIIFHPFLVPTYTILVFLNSVLGEFLLSSINTNAQWYLIGTVFLSTCILPFFINKGIYFTNKSETKQNIKVLSLISLSIFTYLTYYLLKDIPLLTLLSNYIFGEVCICVIASIITAFWNISIYGMVWGGMVGFLFFLCLMSKSSYLCILLVSIIISGAMGWNRLKTESHSAKELYFGYTVGFAIALIILILLSY